MKKQREVLESVQVALKALAGETFDVLTVSKPQSVDEAANLAKIISKLSPLVGNLIEFKTTQFLNERVTFGGLGTWKRQDPGFPDVIFDGSLNPSPGLEIKAWFPLATEITGRFKDSQSRFLNDEIDLAILAWLPEYLFWGKPKILDVCVVSGKSVAKARDTYYHRPPHYIVIEPEDTTSRTSNLQQSNTNGYVIQDDSPEQLAIAQSIVDSWGKDGRIYKTNAAYQSKLKQLQAKVKYRLDTNYAKIDRIEHEEIESFKSVVMNRVIFGRTIKQWGGIINALPEETIAGIL